MGGNYHEVNEVKPRFSTTEERVFKQCRLAHHFEYDLGFRRVLANRKLSVGILTHEGMDLHYRGNTWFEIEAHIKEESEKQWELILNNSHSVGYAEAITSFQSDRDMVLTMVHGFREWAAETELDKDWETVAVEEAHEIEIEGLPCTIPVRMDLVQRNLLTGRIRVVDHKTCKYIPNNLDQYTFAEQNANYQLACLAIYDERPTEMAYTFLRKIVPTARTKPPYFERKSIPLTREELVYRVQELREVTADRYDETRRIYSAPDNCCGSWKNDWQRPCQLVRMGYDPEQALIDSPGYELSDAYARYADLEEDE